MKNFALIGAAGYIAPRHMKAIKEVGGDLSVAFDVNDSVGVIDSFFPQSAFQTDYPTFQEILRARQKSEDKIDYVAICSPNFHHKEHMEFAMATGADAICEKPLVLNPSDLDDLRQIEIETGKRVNSILQLRLHPAILELREMVQNSNPTKIFDVNLGYFTSRGPWYHSS